jgi:hypothetical protein
MIGMYEPIIVTTLRRYHGRGASNRLLTRLAGGPRDWRLLNESWNIDGRLAHVAPELPPADRDGDAVLKLSAAERRLAILQIADETAARRAEFPKAVKLADYFGVSRQSIEFDLQDLTRRGALAWHLGRPVVEDGSRAR